MCTQNIGADLDRAVEIARVDSGGKRIIKVGRLKAKKSYAAASRAKIATRYNGRKATTTWSGRILRTHSHLRSLDLEEHVFMHEHVADPTPSYRAADLFVLISDHKGFGMVIVEALACGLPVVATDCPGGPSEILAGGAWGRLVPPGDGPALAAAMALSLSEPRDESRLRRRASDFSIPTLAKKYFKMMLPEFRIPDQAKALNV